MYYPEASPASATSAGWPTAAEKTCCHSAVFCFTSHCQQPRHRPSTSLRLGRAPSAKAPCTSCNDSPLPKSSSRKPDSHILMTRPDPSLNSATLAGLSPCSLNVCSTLQNKPFCPAINSHSMARVPGKSLLSKISEHLPRPFSPAMLMIDAVENP